MRRRLSPYERVIWAAGEVLPANVAAVARVYGRAVPDRLSGALAAARLRHPLLGARIACRGRRHALLTTDGVPGPPLRVVGADGRDTWARVVEEELQRRFDTATGPLARFVLVDDGDAFDLVCVFHQLVADALSACVVVRDVLHRLAGPAPDPAPAAALPPPADGLLPVGRARLADLVPFARTLGGDGARPPQPAGPLSCATWTLCASEVTALRSRCRTERATLQSALCLAFARALPHPARIAVGADLRRVLVPPPGEAVGLYAANFLLSVDGTTHRDFWSLARDIRAAVRHRVHADELASLVRTFGLLAPLPRRAIGSVLRRSEAQGARFDVFLGSARVPIPLDYGPLRLSALYGAAHTSLSGAPIVLAAGVGGRLYLSVTSTDPDGSAKLCERAMAHLKDAVTR
ncbi:hypothetical protein ACFY2W_26480 [Streptomyces sp. NPDC001262]|uniref:hypothetical protein n=1 Tax=unclassified Streptomyces TaxID=2593676 RepID=UPI00368B542E